MLPLLLGAGRMLAAGAARGAASGAARGAITGGIKESVKKGIVDGAKNKAKSFIKNKITKAKKVSPDKLIPRSKKGGGGKGLVKRKSTSIIKRPTSSIVKSEKGSAGSSTQEKEDKGKQEETFNSDELIKELTAIKETLIKIKAVLGSNLASKLKDQRNQRILKSKQKASEKESELEKKKPDKSGGPKLGLPKKKLSFLDMIWRFISNVLMGSLLNFLFNYVPQIIKMFEDISKGLTNVWQQLRLGIITLTTVFPKQIKFLAKLTAKIIGPPAKLIGKLLFKAGNVAANLFKKAGSVIFNLIKGPLSSLIKRVGGEALEQGIKSTAKGAASLAGKAAGAAGSAVGSTAKILKRFKAFSKIFKRVPIVGMLIGVGIDLAMGESLDRALIGAAGAALGAAIGGAIGQGVIPIPVVGAAVGGFVGSAIGDWAAKKLYGDLTGRVAAADKANPIERRASGGGIGGFFGSLFGGGSRTAPKKSVVKVQKSATKSRDISPVVEKKAKEDILRDEKSLNRFKELSSIFAGTPFVGQLLKMGIDIGLGAKIDKADTDIAAQDIGFTIGNALENDEFSVPGLNKRIIGPLVKNLTEWAKKKIFYEVKNREGLFPTIEKSEEQGPSSTGGGGGGGDGSNIEGAELSGSIAQKAFQLAKVVQSKFGLKDFQAAAIVGTWLREGFGSGYPDVKEGGKRGAPQYNAPSTGGYGFAQWTNTQGGGPNDRLNRALIHLGMKDNPRPWTVDDNLKVFEWETKTYYSNLWPALKKTENLNDAVRTFVGIYEAGGMSGIARYERQEGGGFIARRLSEAQKVLKTLQSGKDASGQTLVAAKTGGGQEPPSNANLANLPKQSKQIVFHWTAGNYTSTEGPYHTVFTGDGKKHQKTPYNQKTPGSLYRPDAINLSLAANPDINQWPKDAQLNAMAKEVAMLAKTWGWSKSSINVRNVSGHGEVGSGKDLGTLSKNISTGRAPSKGPRGSKDNYGPTVWGGDGSRWDLSRLSPGDRIGTGEEKFRHRVKANMGGGFGFNHHRLPNIAMGGHTVTSSMGMRNFALSPGMHMGVDIAGTTGEPLQAFTDGVIEATSPPSPSAGYGNWVNWVDDKGIGHLYAHMNKPPLVKAGQRVKKGTILGELGSTGKSSGPHLHWEAAINPRDTGMPKSSVLSRFNPLSKYNKESPFGGSIKPDPAAAQTETGSPMQPGTPTAPSETSERQLTEADISYSIKGDPAKESYIEALKNEKPSGGGMGGGAGGANPSTPSSSGVDLWGISPSRNQKLNSNSSFADAPAHHRSYTTEAGIPRDYAVVKSGVNPVANPNAGRGENVVAGVSGKVTFAGFAGNAGNLVEISSGNKKIIRLLHLDKIKASSGQNVSPSTIIGTQGNTGTRDIHVHVDGSQSVHTNWIKAMLGGQYAANPNISDTADTENQPNQPGTPTSPSETSERQLTEADLSYSIKGDPAKESYVQYLSSIQPEIPTAAPKTPPPPPVLPPPTTTASISPKPKDISSNITQKPSYDQGSRQNIIMMPLPQQSGTNANAAGGGGGSPLMPVSGLNNTETAVAALSLFGQAALFKG